MSRPRLRKRLFLLFSSAVVGGVYNVLSIVSSLGDPTRIPQDRSEEALVPKNSWPTNPTQCSSSSGRSETNATTGTSHRILSYPQWNDPNGISWNAIESYIRHADQHLTSGKNLLNCPRGGCPMDMPNVLYIFGASTHRMAPLLPVGNDHTTSATAGMDNQTGSTGSTGVDPNEPLVWVEGRRRKLIGSGFAKRYPIVEELMQLSLNYMLTNPDQAQSQYVRLYQLLFPNGHHHHHHQESIPTRDTTGIPPLHYDFLGIPLIMNLGDNRQCHHYNLFSEELYNNTTNNNKNGTEPRLVHSVPVFTLAVPKTCRYAFPIPHPAVLDTAKVYGHQWEIILERRRQRYPLTNQTKQAVWRGSPTGGLMRQRLVYMANTIPSEYRKATTIRPTGTSTNENDNHTEEEGQWFNVGFGKPLHKINAKYNKGPRIRGRSRIWFEDFGHYRIVLDADGSSWSERFPCLLCLNTVVAKLDPFFVDYLWPTLQPGQEFVPIANDSSNLWSVLVPLLEDDGNHTGSGNQRTCIIARAQQWCRTHMTYESMIQFFLKSLDQYVRWLDQGDPNWLEKWQALLLHNMPPKHHHWQPLPVQKPKAYFPLWREGVLDRDVESDICDEPNDNSNDSPAVN